MTKLEKLFDTSMLDLLDTFQSLIADSSGATAIEYGLIAALIAIAAVGAMSSLGTQISKTLNNSATIMSQG
jgi:pilus assembly protein Flp/PilA